LRLAADRRGRIAEERSSVTLSSMGCGAIAIQTAELISTTNVDDLSEKPKCANHENQRSAGILIWNLW
jgi:hypothetical protein